MTKIAIALFVVLFVAAYFTLRQADQYKEFMKTAEKAQALIIKKEERATGQKNNRKEYWVTYNFSSPGGKTHTVQELVEYPDIWQGMRSGQAVAIYYNRNNASQSYLAASVDRRLGIANIIRKQ